MGERVGVGAAPFQYRMNFLFSHGFRTGGRAGSLGMHLGGRSHAAADAEMCIRDRYGAYFRKMAIDGYILVVDRSDTKAYIRELQRGFRNTVPPARLFASLRVGSAPFQSASATRAGVGAASVPACARATACMWRKFQNVTAKQMSAYTSVIDAFAEPKGGNAPVFEISE